MLFKNKKRNSTSEQNAESFNVKPAGTQNKIHSEGFT